MPMARDDGGLFCGEGRKTLMSGDIGIGKPLKGEWNRDAIHIAVAPVTAGARLRPGQGLQFQPEGQTELVVGFSSIGYPDSRGKHTRINSSPQYLG